MSFKMRVIIMRLVYWILLMSVIYLDVINGYDDNNHQSKIVSNKGNLQIESARDKNITIRLIGNGKLLANDIDLISSIATRTTSPHHQQQHSHDTDNSLNTQEMILLSDLQREVLHLNNNTNTYPLRLNRINQRIENIDRRINLLLGKLRTNKCEAFPCKNDGHCIPMFDGFKCYCTDKWQGETCEVDVDECLQFNGSDLGCQNGGLCQNELGGYSCQCIPGFAGIHCTQRSIDCLKSTPGELCGYGICVPAKTNFGYKCICEEGWTTNGTTPECTTDINECELNKNHCHSTCINLPGSFHCAPCREGYTGNGIVCRDINECENNNGGCSVLPQVTCINTEGSFHCGDCPVGWAGDGILCSRSADSKECPTIGNPCFNHKACQYISGEMVCTCPPGWVGNGYGTTGCQFLNVQENPCDHQNPCANGGTCIQDGDSYRCLCLDGFDNYANCTAFSPCTSNPCHNYDTCQATSANTFICKSPSEISDATTCLEPHSCNGILTGETGSLHHFNYTSNCTCSWLIKLANQTKILNITFNKFDLQESEKCQVNWLEIYDGDSSGSPLIGRFFGSQIPKPDTIYSSHYQIYLRFRSDNSNQTNKGFILNWESIDPICGGVFHINDKNGKGIIKSLGYPGKSPPNRDCSWKLVGPFGWIFEFRFFEVSLGGVGQHCDDFLKITDSGELLEKICKNGSPQPKKSTSNIVSIDFHTDQINYDSAFQLHYELVSVTGLVGCGGHFTNATGTISAPAFERGIIADNMVCLYLIEQPVGTFVKFEFIEFDSTNFRNCSVHSIEIYDNKADTGQLIIRFCGDVEPNQQILSTSNFLLIKYSSIGMNLDNQLMTTSFKAKYSLNCDQTFYINTGAIESPNYPNPYYENMICIYTIIAPMHNIITLRFDDFMLSHENNCNSTDDNDSIEVYRKLYKAERYCRHPLTVIVSQTSRLKFVLHSFRNAEKAQGFRASYRYERISCGGVLDRSNGRLDFVGVSISFLSEVKFCEWIFIAAHRNLSISLEFQFFELGNNNCSNNLQLFSNTTHSDQKLGDTLCGSNTPFNFVYNANILTLILNVGTNLRKFEGFYLKYEFVPRKFQEKDCGGNYSAGFGELQSPNFPAKYANDIDCVWILEAPIGHQIELLTEAFSIEKMSSNVCADYLEIRNGMTEKSPIIGKYCGINIPQRIPSFTNHLYIKFHTDSTVGSAGFKMNWVQTTTGCGGTLTAYEGSIHSPHYPDLINGAGQCDWSIIISHGSKIQFNITNVMGEAFNDQLMIYDGPNSWSPKIKLDFSSNYKFSGQSTTNQLFIRFISHSNNNAGNIKFVFEYITNCTQINLHDLHGIIESPNFPDNYPNNLDCQWHISGWKKNAKIKLMVSHLELEFDDELCPFDKLDIIDLENDREISNQIFCKQIPYLLISRGYEFLIRFKTDFSQADKGFRMEYQIEGCGEYFSDWHGSMESPNYPYSVNVYCVWTIETEIGNVIQLNITDFHIDPDNRDCQKNRLVLSNDKNESHPIISTCDSVTKLITSSGKLMFIRFETDNFHSKKYFKASYIINKSRCGGIISADKAVIISPNYPEDYPTNINCTWEIIGEHFHRYQLSFLTFDLENSKNCEADFVEIYDGNVENQDSLILRHCGDQLPPNNNLLKSTSDRILIIFKSNNDVVRSGWKLNIIKNCGTTLNSSPSGYLTKQMNDQNCAWVLKSATEGARITLTFVQIECNCAGLDDSTCLQQNGITISDGDSRTFCSFHPPPITSSGQSLTITAKVGAFNVHYSESLMSCGGIMKSLHGFFTTPLYPNSYPINIECIWQIQGRLGNFIELRFHALDITESAECNNDYVEIRQNNENGQILSVVCGNQIPATILAYEMIWIKFRSQIESSVAAGFRASYKFVHDNELLTQITGDSGTIEAPPIASIRGETNSYTWRIMVADKNVVMLTFQEYSQGLTLYDGFDENAAIIEILHSPSERMSSSNVVYIVSDNSILHDFVINWNGVSIKDGFHKDCNQVRFIEPNIDTNLSSPNYPNSYANNLDCSYILKPADPITHVYLELYAADLQNFRNCNADYLLISSSQNLIHWNIEQKVCQLKFTDDNKPHLKITGKPFLMVNFHSDGAVSGSGFTSMIKVGCGSYLTAPNGLISVEMINVTSAHPDCVWQIELALGKQIEFQFQFDNDSDGSSFDDNCPDQYAMIQNGLDDDSSIIKPNRICRRNQIQSNTPLVSTSNKALVKFHFGQSSSQIQWKLIYQEHISCGSEIHLTKFINTINITSPNYPNSSNPYSECIYTIVAPAGQTIQIEFVDLFNSIIKLPCRNEYIELHDGSTNLARSIGKFCTGQQLVQRSSGNVMYLKFVANIPEPGTGFKAILSTSQCGGTINSQLSGSISSENYPIPGHYPSNTNCSYIIRVPSHLRLSLTITDLHLPFFDQRLNESDRLEIYSIAENTDQLISILYGNNNTIRNLAFDSNEVIIKFITFKANTKYRGFQISYAQIVGRCYQDIVGDYGVIEMPRYYSIKSKYELCRWLITVPKGRTVSARIYDIQYYPESDVARGVHRPSISFFNDFQSFNEIGVIDNYYNATLMSQWFNSTDNIMLIYIKGGIHTAFKNLKIEYNSYQPSICPGDISAANGEIIISSPTNINNRKIVCHSEIILNGKETMAFHIKSLQYILKQEQLMPIIRFNVKNYWQFRDILENTTNTNIAISMTASSMDIQIPQFTEIHDFSINYKKHQCGGLVNIQTDFPITGIIREFDDNYGRIDCAWELMFPTQFTHNISISLNLTSDDCTKEYFTVTTKQFALETHKLCGNFTYHSFKITNHLMHLHYHADTYSMQSNYYIDFVPLISCGKVVNLFNTYKSIEFNQIDYKNNLECIWKFNGLNGFSTVIEFQNRFFIESSANCTKDSLSIQQKLSNTNYDDWYVYPKLCGRHLPNAINTTNGNIFKVIFKSDANGIADGFYMKFSQYCGGIYVVTEKRQTIKSPDNNWRQQFDHLNCEYTLRTDSNQMIQVKFKHFDLRTNSINNYKNCVWNKLKILLPNKQMEPTEFGEYCKKDELTELRSHHFITLSYEVLRAGQGYFEFDYYLETCGGDVITEPISIYSPIAKDETTYPLDMNCNWKIKAGINQDIVVKFNYIDILPDKYCQHNYIGIYHGLDVLKANRLALLCGNLVNKAPHIKISNNTATIVAVANGFSEYGKGFAADIIFTPKCDKHIYLDLLNLTHYSYELVDYYYNPPNEYSENLDCHILFKVNDGYELEIEFNDFNIANCDELPLNGTCSCDYLEIFDSNTNTIQSQLIGKYCGNDLPGKFHTTQQYLLLRFVTDGQRNGRGFKATITRQLAICGTELIQFEATMQAKKLNSPNFGLTDAYPPNVYCKWIILSNDSFYLHFNKFDLQEISQDTGKCNDYFQLAHPDVFSIMGKQAFCGNNTPNDITILREWFNEDSKIGASIELIFKSDGFIEKAGFSLEIRPAHAGCNSNLTYTQLSGMIIHHRANCSYNIIVPKHSMLSFYIRYITKTNTSNCIDNLKFYDKETNDLLNIICYEQEANPESVFLRTNQVHLTSFSKIYETNSQPIYLNIFYIANPNGAGCGGQITELKGFFTSPFYPDNTRNYTNCRWNIDLPANHEILITFADFSMGDKIHCQHNYLQIIKVASDGHETVLRQYCGNDNPDFVKSSGSKFAIVYKKTMNFHGNGWSLIFSVHETDADNGNIILNNN